MSKMSATNIKYAIVSHNMFWQVIKTASDGDTREISGPVTEEKIIYMRLCQYTSISGCYQIYPQKTPYIIV